MLNLITAPRLTSVSVTDLYGIFNHNIPINDVEGVTLLHGPNGLGKTVILKLIAAAFRAEAHVFWKTPFGRFCMTFADGSRWAIEKSLKDSLKDGESRGHKLVVTRAASDGTIDEEQVGPDIELPLRVLHEIDESVPAPYTLSGRQWRDHTGRIYSVEEILNIFPEAREQVPDRYLQHLEAASWAVSGSNVFVVEADRLRSSGFSSNGPRPGGRWRTPADDASKVTRVEQYSSDVVKQISSVLAAYAKNSQERDRTFPERLVQFLRDTRTPLDPRTILNKMQDLENKRRRLIALGFLDSETGLQDLTEDEVRRAPEALTIYVEDVEAKLGAFDEMARKVGKLIDVINERFEYKQIGIDRRRGFEVLQDADSTVALSELSSGEQNELIVLYELLFMTVPGGLVLVDEPEISLHVAWQSRFLADLIDILKLTGTYAIVATHSPSVIGSRWDLTVELSGPLDKKRRTF
jgi:hypothetical protein